MRPAQRGNILFLILLAVVLFAALAYAVTQSMRGGGRDAGDESARTMAASIIQFAALVENEVSRKMLVDSVKERELAFDSTVYKRYTDPASNWPNNPNCASNRCRIFASAGGSVPEQTFEKATLPWTSSTTYASSRSLQGYPRIARGDVVNVGTSKQDLLLGIMSLRKDVCDAINTALGIPKTAMVTVENVNSMGQPAYMAGNSYWDFDENAVGQIGDQEPAFRGQPSGCINTGANESYYFYHVILAR